MNVLLENGTIRLRAPEPEDEELLYAWENDTRIWENGASIVPLPRCIIRQYLADYRQDIYIDRQLRLMMTLRDTGEPVGTADLYDFEPFHQRAGVGILTASAHRRRGYALQALALLEDYAFRFLNLRLLHAIIPERNAASIRLFHRAGYRQTGLLEEWLRSGDSFGHALIMQRTNSGDKHNVNFLLKK
ncbi:MAG: GNAT family N-acetyltransferase [Proteiniphilum sp.]|jgi:diamine N-acetyltransferase|nr:GNAT family N-acetyltransferase [Proteiniphilum sp.]